MRALVVTNMWPSPERPALGSFVRDQVRALRATGEAEVEVFAFAGSGLTSYPRAARALHARRKELGRFDIVHAHFGLTGWVALAAGPARRVLTLHGNDVRHPRSRALTRAVLPAYDLVGAASAALREELPGARRRARTAILPVGIDLTRFRPLPRAQARERLGLPVDEPVVLFAHDPARLVKRHDLALDAAGDTRVVALGSVAPEEVPYWHNAANAVLVPSDHEGFGLAVLEALACDVPVLATPVGNHAMALEGVPGCLCAPYDRATWRAALQPHLDHPDPRVPGRARAALFSAERMAERVLAAWRDVLAQR